MVGLVAKIITTYIVAVLVVSIGFTLADQPSPAASPHLLLSCVYLFTLLDMKKRGRLLTPREVGTLILCLILLDAVFQTAFLAMALENDGGTLLETVSLMELVPIMLFVEVINVFSSLIGFLFARWHIRYEQRKQRTTG